MQACGGLCWDVLLCIACIEDGRNREDAQPLD